MAQHFVAAYEQKGDFEVVRVKDKVQKNGGNVVTYFLTPDMRVVHFVVGPVSGGKLLDEASWAHGVFEKTRVRDRGDLTKAQAVKASRLQVDAVRGEHMAMIGGDAANVMRQMTARRKSYQDSQRRGSSYRQASYDRTSAGSGNRRAAPQRWESLMWGMGGANEDQVHRLLAFDPLPPLDAVDDTVFRRLAGQTVNDQDGSVGRAIADVRRAEKSGRPVMFVFYRDWHGWRNSHQRKILRQSPNNKRIAQFTVVNLPLKEQPALSARLPDFKLPEVGQQATVEIVLADCRLKQSAVFSEQVPPEAFTAALDRTIAENYLAFAEQLVDDGRQLDAKRVLYKARRSDDRQVAARAEAMLAPLLASDE